MAAPAFAEIPTLSVNLALRGQEEKSIVTVTGVEAPGARLPRFVGNDGAVTEGVQADPFACARLKLVSIAAFAAPGPLLVMLNAHWRVFARPDLPVIDPPKLVAPARKFAVTDCAEFIVTVVDALFALATFPVQLANE